MSPFSGPRPACIPRSGCARSIAWQRPYASTPQLESRLDAAAWLVITGAVSQDAKGLWRVARRVSLGPAWQADGSCDCPDAEGHAPDGRCAHLLAVEIYQQALTQLQGRTRPTVRGAGERG